MKLINNTGTNRVIDALRQAVRNGASLDVASKAVFRDGAFADDVAKTNLTAILQQHGLGNVRSL